MVPVGPGGVDKGHDSPDAGPLGFVEEPSVADLRPEAEKKTCPRLARPGIAAELHGGLPQFIGARRGPRADPVLVEFVLNLVAGLVGLQVDFGEEVLCGRRAMAAEDLLDQDLGAVEEFAFGLFGNLSQVGTPLPPITVVAREVFGQGRQPQEVGLLAVPFDAGRAAGQEVLDHREGLVLQAGRIQFPQDIVRLAAGGQLGAGLAKETGKVLGGQAVDKRQAKRQKTGATGLP